MGFQGLGIQAGLGFRLSRLLLLEALGFQPIAGGFRVPPRASGPAPHLLSIFKTSSMKGSQ